jgi:hypothetical protein
VWDVFANQSENFDSFASHSLLSLQTGKLRVRCHRCQEGSILIHRDPCGWSDVLDQPGRIMGHCLSGKCSSDGNEDSQAEFSKNLFKIRNQNKHDG